MLPNLRLMIAAVLTSVLALSCGFGIFAAFRVSHEPFARLPAAMAAPQLATENAAQLLAYDLRANDVAGRPVDIPLRGGEEATASASAAEIHATAYAEEAEQRGAADAVVAAVLQPPAAPDAQDKPAAGTDDAIGSPAQSSTTTPVTVSELPPLPQNDARASDTAEVSANDQRPREPSSPPPAAANQIPADAGTTDAPSSPAPGAAADVQPSTTAVADLTPPPTAADEPSAEPAANEPVAHSEAAEHVALVTPPDFPLPRERPNNTVQTQAPVANSASERRPGPAATPAKRSLAVAANPPKRPRAVASSVRAVRFTSAYYAQAQYVQSADPGYGYGQGGEAAQEPIVVRRVVRPRLVAKRAY
jgi:hypothetical protein